jgi:tellurite resistance protein
MTESRLPSLSKDAFLALAAVAWADGKLDPEEADAIVRAAAEENLPLEDLDSVEQDVMAFKDRLRDSKDQPDLSFLDRSGMSKQDRVFVYAVACWIAQIDQIVTPQESDALRLLGERLGVPDRLRARAEELAREIASLPDGDRPERYDLKGLREKIGDRLGPSQSTRTPG